MSIRNSAELVAAAVRAERRKTAKWRAAALDLWRESQNDDLLCEEATAERRGAAQEARDARPMKPSTAGTAGGPEAEVGVWTLAERAAAGEQVSGAAIVEIARALLRLRDATGGKAPTRRVGRCTHLVAIIREGTPEVHGFEDLATAVAWHDTAGAQWSESYLTEVVKGPLT